MKKRLALLGVLLLSSMATFAAPIECPSGMSWVDGSGCVVTCPPGWVSVGFAACTPESRVDQPPSSQTPPGWCAQDGNCFRTEQECREKSSTLCYAVRL